MITKQTEKHILWAQIDRPEARNAINFDTMDELEELVGRAEENEQIRVLVLSGTGEEAFIAGGDLKEFHSIKSEEKAIEMSERMHSLLLRLERLPCWTIACINGSAYGGGVEILLAFDFHIAADHAKFGFTQGKFYLPPGWGGLTRLAERTGRSKALQLFAEARILSAQEALATGIIEKISESSHLETGTVDWAQKLSRNGRDYIRALKDTANKMHPERLKMLKEEIEPFARLWVSEEHEQRVERFLERNR